MTDTPSSRSLLSKYNILAWITIIFVIAITSAAGYAWYNIDQQRVKSEAAAEKKRKENEAILKVQEERLKSTTLLETARKTPSLSTFVNLLTQSGLDSTINEQVPYTIFAPSNLAISKLPTSSIENLLKTENKEQLSSVLGYHIVPGSLRMIDLADGEILKTLNGQILTVKKTDTSVSIGGVVVTFPDIVASNGVIHMVDTVMMPPQDSMQISQVSSKLIPAMVTTQPTLSNFGLAVDSAQLQKTLEGEGPFTVFAPDDQAFKSFTAKTKTNLFIPENKSRLNDILRYHIVTGLIQTSDFKDGQKLKTIKGDDLIIKKSGNTTTINGAVIISEGMMAKNGVIYTINGLLLPPS